MTPEDFKDVDVPFKFMDQMTLEEAKTGGLWEAIEIERTAKEVKIGMHLQAAIVVPTEVLAETSGDRNDALVECVHDRMNVDLEELMAVLYFKLSDTGLSYQTEADV